MKSSGRQHLRQRRRILKICHGRQMGRDCSCGWPCQGNSLHARRVAGTEACKQGRYPAARRLEFSTGTGNSPARAAPPSGSLPLLHPGAHAETAAAGYAGAQAGTPTRLTCHRLLPKGCGCGRALPLSLQQAAPPPPAGETRLLQRVRCRIGTSGSRQPSTSLLTRTTGTAPQGDASLGIPRGRSSRTQLPSATKSAPKRMSKI